MGKVKNAKNAKNPKFLNAGDDFSLAICKNPSAI